MKLCALLKEWAQLGTPPEDLQDLSDNNLELYTMYPCYLVQFGETDYLTTRTADHVYSDYKPLITAVYNRNHKAVEMLLLNNHAVVYPDAVGYGIFQGDRIVIEATTSAVDIIMQRDDLEILNVLIKNCINWRPIYTVVWDSLQKLAEKHNAHKCLNRIISMKDTMAYTIPQGQYAPTFLPSIEKLLTHIGLFTSPFATHLQCVHAVKMFSCTAGSTYSSADSSHGPTDADALQCDDKNVLQQDPTLLHFYVILNVCQLLLKIAKSESRDMSRYSYNSYLMIAASIVCQSPRWDHIPTYLFIEIHKLFLQYGFPHKLHIDYTMLKLDDQCFSDIQISQQYVYTTAQLTYAGVEINNEQMEKILMERHFVTPKSQSARVGILQNCVSMMPHHVFERYRLQLRASAKLKQIPQGKLFDLLFGSGGPIQYLPIHKELKFSDEDEEPRSLVALCRLWLCEHLPKGRMPLISTQLGLPRRCVDLLTLGTHPVLMRTDTGWEFQAKLVTEFVKLSRECPHCSEKCMVFSILHHKGYFALC